MTDETGADEHDGGVVDIDALEAAEAEAEAAKGKSEDKDDQGIEAESPPADEDNVEEKTEVSDGLQKRFDTLAKQIREAKDESVSERDKRIAAEKRIEELEANAPPEAKKTLADFNYDESAYQSYVREDAAKDARLVARQEAEKVNSEFSDKRKATEARTEYQNRESEFAKTKADFESKCYDDSLKISRETAEVIREIDVGPELFYFLGSNPDKADEIARLSPAVASMEVASIVMDIRNEKAKATEKKASKAPPPPKKIGGVDASLKAVSTDDPDSDKLSDDEWFKREELRQAKARG